MTKQNILKTIRESLREFSCFKSVDLFNYGRGSNQPPTISIKIELREEQMDLMDEICQPFAEAVANVTTDAMFHVSGSWYIQEFISARRTSSRIGEVVAFNEMYVCPKDGVCTFRSVNLP